jgi:hypothetical protein
MTRQTVTAKARITRRKALLESLIEQLEQGIGVSTKSIKQALTADEYRDYRSHSNPIPTPRFPAHYYRELKEYNTRLREADRMHTWAERLTPRSKVNPCIFITRYNRVEAAYEHAFERLEELCLMYPAIVGLLDRPVFFNVGEYPSHDPESAPRQRGSRSKYAPQVNHGQEIDTFQLNLKFLKTSLLNIDGLTETTWLDFSIQTLAEDMGDDIPLPDSDPPYQPDWDGEFDYE